MVVGDAHLMETCRVLEALRLVWFRGLLWDFILVLAGLGLLVLASNLRWGLIGVGGIFRVTAVNERGQLKPRNLAMT